MCQERCGPSQLRDPKRAPRRTPRPHPPSPTAANLRSGSESGSMAAKAKNDDEAPVLSEVEARGGVTGHHVRHVLAFGLAGSVAAFVMIALYFYYAKLISTLSQLPGRVDLAKLVYFAIPLALGAVAIVLVLGLWNMVARPRPEVSQTLMRWRVALQFIALCLVMAALYLSARS